MAFTSFSISRRVALAALAGALGRPGFARAARGGQPIVTMLGDSITAGYGLQQAQALPAQLAARLHEQGVSAVVRAAGVSGDTTADALARLDFSVQPDTTLCLVAVGANDLLQGIEPAVVQANLAAIVGRLRARRIHVLIAGMRAPPNLGAYARAFNAVFPKVAREAHAFLYPDLLDGVAGDNRLNQYDGIHPNPAGVRIIAQRLAPTVTRALAGRG